MMSMDDAASNHPVRDAGNGVPALARRTFLRAFSGLLGGLLAPAVLRAAPKKTPPPAARKPPNSPDEKAGSQLRLWKATDAARSPISLRITSTGGSDIPIPEMLKTDAQEYQFTSYADMPAGPSTVEISAPGQSSVSLSRYFTAGGKLTLLVRFQNAKLSAEWIDDSNNSAGSGCVFRAYNLLHASGDIEVSLGTILTVHLPSTRSSLRLSDVKPAMYAIVVKGTGGAEKEFSANLDLDFGLTRCATLLIYPDAYGRIRPQISTI